MIEKTGDLWTYPSQYTAITTNGVVSEWDGKLIMGAGVAKKAKELFPELPLILGKYVEKYGNRVFILPQFKILTFPTKHHWKDNSSLFLIKQSAEQIVKVVDKYKIQSVAMTRPGCGNGNLDWNIVKKWICDILDDRFIILENK